MSETKPQSEVERLRDQILNENDARAFTSYTDYKNTVAAYEQAIRNEAAGEIERLKRELTFACRNNEKRNKELDALHYVWCSGGCEGGAHRWTDQPLTEEIVSIALRNTQRLIQHFRNRKCRASNEGRVPEDSPQLDSEIEKAFWSFKRWAETIGAAAPSTGEPAAEIERLETENAELRKDFKEVLASSEQCMGDLVELWGRTGSVVSLDTAVQDMRFDALKTAKRMSKKYSGEMYLSKLEPAPVAKESNEQ